VSISISIQCKASKPTEVMHIQVLPCATESSFFKVCIIYGIESNVYSMGTKRTLHCIKSHKSLSLQRVCTFGEHVKGGREIELSGRRTTRAFASHYQIKSDNES
jgi:hypothetical protein